MKGTSAVEYLLQAFEGAYGKEVGNVIRTQIEQAKAMEKEQIIETFGDSRILSITNNCSSGEQYYNETFNTNK